MKRRSFLHALLAAGTAPAVLRAAPPPKIKIAQIGTRHAHASGKLSAILKYPEVFEVVGYAEPAGPSPRGPFKNLPHLGEEQLLNTPGLQAVAVETAVPDLVPTARRCIDAGKHVHLDKPPGDMASFEALHAAAAKQQRVIQMGYMLRYNPGFQFLFKVARDGWLGNVFEVNANMGKFINDASRKQLNVPGGAMFELGCHLIDAAVTLLGKPTAVHPFLQRTRPDKDTLQDNTLAVLEYPKATATIRVSLVEVDGFKRRQFVACGDRGTVDMKPMEPPQLRLALDQARDPYRKGYQDVALPRSPGRYDGEFLDLAKILRGEKKPDWDSAHDIAVHDTVLKASGIL